MEGKALNKESRMFKSVDRTWSPQHGCLYSCSYCNAKRIAERLKGFNSNGKYSKAFFPGFWEEDMNKTFQPGKTIFVGYMGDMFGYWVDGRIIQRIIEKVAQYPETDFLFLTKNPRRYHDFQFTDNCILGTTFETTKGEMVQSSAMSPLRRLSFLAEVKHKRKFISFEPLMEFDLATLKIWITEIKPEVVEIGLDNYHNHLREPPWWKVYDLINYMKFQGIIVNEKKSLDRIKGV
jgi:protein gp37